MRSKDNFEQLNLIQATEMHQPKQNEAPDDNQKNPATNLALHTSYNYQNHTDDYSFPAAMRSHIDEESDQTIPTKEQHINQPHKKGAANPPHLTNSSLTIEAYRKTGLK